MYYYILTKTFYVPILIIFYFSKFKRNIVNNIFKGNNERYDNWLRFVVHVVLQTTKYTPYQIFVHFSLIRYRDFHIRHSLKVIYQYQISH